MILKNAFRFLWHIWFYLLTGIITIAIAPILFILTSNRKWYASFYWVARHLWGIPILYGMGFFPQIRRYQPFEKNRNYMLVANHTSMTDIMLMLMVSNVPFVFVGKKELSKMPIFGYFYSRVAILVDRSDAQSRRNVYTEAFKRLDAGLSICIFPEGRVPNDESIVLDQFKDGAFRLAIECQIPIVPITFFDNKRRFPFRFSGGSPGRMRVQVHSFIVTSKLSHRSELKKQAYETILQSLQKNDYV